MLAALYFLTPVLLFLLGPDYEHLRLEFKIFSVGMVLNFIIGCIVHINSAKAWIFWSSKLQIIGSVIGMIAGAYYLDMSTLSGVLFFGSHPLSCLMRPTFRYGNGIQ